MPEAPVGFVTSGLDNSNNTHPKESLDLHSIKTETHFTSSDATRTHPDYWIHFSDEEPPDPDEENCGKSSHPHF